MKIDFRTKLFLTIIIGLSATEGSISMNYKYLGILLAVFPYLLAILDKKWSLIGKGLFYTGIAVVGQIVASKYPNSYLGMVFNLYCGIILRILPGVMMGYYTVSTTKMSDLVYSLKKIKFPDYIIIPISVMFRFFYSIKEDYKIIGEAMYMHGLTMKNFIKNPAKILEYRFVPLLMVVSQTADNVAISAMTRGMKMNKERSSISSARLKTVDYVLLSFGIYIIILFIRIKIC